MKTPITERIAMNEKEPTTVPGHELRRFGDIVAFPGLNGEYTAFHSRNLEVAEISREAFNQMETVSIAEAVVPFALKIANSETSESIELWNKEASDQVTTQRLDGIIRALTINTTQICNLACAYCAAGGDGTYNDPIKNISIEKTLPQLKFFIDKVPAHGSFHITFLGGEPLLHPKALVALGNYAKELGQEKEINFSMKIITNGTLITEEIIKDLAPLKPSWNISIDGPATINDRVRPSKNGKSSTEMTLAGLQKLVSAREDLDSITLHAVFNRENMNVLATYNFFQSLEIDHFEFTLDVFEKDADVTAAFINQMDQVAALAFEKGGETELRKILTFDQYFRSLDGQIRRENHCGSGKSLLSIDARNQVFTCPLEVSHKENLVGVGSYVKQEALEGLQNPLIELNNCQNCWARFVCGGGCMYNHKALTGNSHTKHQQYCIKTRSLLKTAILYYKQSRAFAG